MVLPEPGRGAAADVAAGERVGDGRGLDGEGFDDAAFGQSGYDVATDAEVSKAGHSYELSSWREKWPTSSQLHRYRPSRESQNHS